MKRRILALVMCVVMAIGLIGTASAKLIQSAEVRYTMNNRTYKRWAELDINSSVFVGSIYLNDTTGGYTPSGYLKAIAEMYDENGKMIKDSGWIINQEGSGSVKAETIRMTSVYQVYCKGTIGILDRVTNTGRFTYLPTGPTAQDSMPYSAIPRTLEVNSHGKTYGTALFATEMDEVPDLISAVGLYGTEGYIKKDDMYPTNFVQEDGQARKGNVSWIPLYDSEENQIGLYEIGSASVACNDDDYQNKLAEVSKKWSVNSLGMTYGNDFDTVYTGGNIYRPTLIAAVGRDKDGNRVEGYILSERESMNTLEDTLNWGKTMEELPIPFFIAPLYNSEFEQIGGFRIGGTLPDTGAEQEAFWATYFASLEG